MNEIDELLVKIRRTPHLIGMKSLSLLVAFLNGYVYRMAKKEAELCEVLPDFQKFIAERYGDKMRHWSFVIEAHCSNSEDAFDKFYELLDEFYCTSNEQQTHCLYKIPDVGVLLEFSDIAKMRAYAYSEKHFECQVISKHTLSGYFRASAESNGDSFYPISGVLKGVIAFDSPEACPNCLWIGKKVNIQDGVQMVGSATITDIFNPLLRIK